MLLAQAQHDMLGHFRRLAASMQLKHKFFITSPQVLRPRALGGAGGKRGGYGQIYDCEDDQVGVWEFALGAVGNSWVQLGKQAY